MPTIELPNDELQAVIAALRRVIEEDRYPLSLRLDPLKAALTRLEAARTSTPKPYKSGVDPEAASPAKADKRGRR